MVDSTNGANNRSFVWLQAQQQPSCTAAGLQFNRWLPMHLACVIHCGKQLATAEGRIVGPDGKLYAYATTARLVFELPKAP